MARSRGTFKPGPDPRRNVKGRPPVQSFRKHFSTAFDDTTRATIARAHARKAAKGSIAHLEIALRILGELGPSPAPQQVNILALIGQQPGGRELVAGLFAALPLRAGEPGGLGGVREPGGGYIEAGVDALAASDADQ